MIVGILHPGEMGSSVAACLVSAGHRVIWASAGRSADTAARAQQDGLEDVGTLHELVAEAELIVSICPPAAALSVAEQVAELGYQGLYLDGNAIAPSTLSKVEAAIVAGGGRFVDGGIIGGPARILERPTALYLSGPDADALRDLAPGTPLRIGVVSDVIGDASALKLCFAAWTKGTDGLLLAIRAAAERLGVGAALDAEWAISQPALHDRLVAAAGSGANKGWRFAPEMREIAQMFGDAGLPSQLHEGAAQVFERIPREAISGEPALAKVLGDLTDPAR